MNFNLDPYQAMASVTDSTTCPGGQCISAQLSPASNQLVLEGNGVSFFVPQSDITIGCLASQVTLYFDAGATPTARIPVLNSTQHTSLIVTLVGYFVPTE